MLFKMDDGSFLGGPLDVLLILRNEETSTYHAAFFKHAPFPGTGGSIDTDVVRLKSDMHHTTGATSLEGAQTHLDELAARIKLPPENLWREEKKVVAWSGELGIVLIVPNWTTNSQRSASAS